MPDEYDAARRRLTNYEKGLYFELGRAHELGETPERGWAQQFRVETDRGTRILDSARTQGKGVQGVERKSGRVNEADARLQLRKDRDGLNSGLITRARWETVAGETIPEKVREDLRGMVRDFGDKFQHVIISRADALRAIQLGQSLVSKQLELIRPYELQRADRARERLEKIRQIVRAQERAEKFRKMQQFREAAARGRAEAPQKIERAREQAEQVRQAREAEKGERARVERAAAERVALEFPVPNQFQEREAADTGAREAADAASVERAAEKEREAAEKEREAAFKALDEARNAAFRDLDEKGRLSEVERLLWLGQATHPQAAVREPPGHAPSVVRGGAGHGRDRSRGISRDR